MKLSIITINYNNAEGLRRTMKSVLSQQIPPEYALEYIVIDGGSTDESVDVIRSNVQRFFPALSLQTIGKPCEGSKVTLCWISEPDKGIYQAMNKGLKMATGDYIQILNSADELAAPDVTARMIAALEETNNSRLFTSIHLQNKSEDYPVPILYGNMLKLMVDGRRVQDRCFAGQDITFMGFYTGTLNHDPAYIRRDLFEKYGYYDESLKIVSDWKWYLQAIILGGEKPVYTDIDVTLFDMTGVSENPANKQKMMAERDEVLHELLPATVLADYKRFAFPIDQIKRLQRHPWAYKLVWFLERVLFKIEKRQFKRTNVQQYQ